MMKLLPWVLAAAGIGLVVYVVNNAPAPQPADGVDEAANQVGAFGTKQRVKGTGGDLLGQAKEGLGKLTGDKEMQGDGLADQAVGTVKDTVGQAAHAVSDALHGNSQVQ